MKKKTYHQPKMKFVTIDHSDIICESQLQSRQNESYNEEEGTLINYWFN